MHDVGCPVLNSINFFVKLLEIKLNQTIFLILIETNPKLKTTTKKQKKAMKRNLIHFKFMCTPDYKKMKLILSFQATEVP